MTFRKRWGLFTAYKIVNKEFPGQSRLDGIYCYLDDKLWSGSCPYSIKQAIGDFLTLTDQNQIASARDALADALNQNIKVMCISVENVDDYVNGRVKM